MARVHAIVSGGSGAIFSRAHPDSSRGSNAIFIGSDLIE
jgi:hypothetical protein